MADGTKIEWTDATVNAVNGCSVHSPGCTNCYAMRLAGSRLKHHPSRAGLTRETKAGPVWTGEVRLHEPALLQPLRWTRPRRIFWNAHGDLFHDAVPDEWIDRVLAVCALTPQHTHQILTKRSARMRAYFEHDGGFGRWGYIEHAARRLVADDRRLTAAMQGRTLAHFGGSNLPNVWLGVSVEDQARADERIPDLLATPAAVRWISAEPLLGPVDLTDLDYVAALARWSGKADLGSGPYEPLVRYDALRGHLKGPDDVGLAKLDWVVVGGESGPGARPMHPDWARSLRDQCAAAGVPFLFKQWGERHPADQSKSPEQLAAMGDMGTALRSGAAHAFDDQWTWKIGKKAAGRHLDGVLHDGFPGAPDMVAF